MLSIDSPGGRQKGIGTNKDCIPMHQQEGVNTSGLTSPGPTISKLVANASALLINDFGNRQSGNGCNHTKTLREG